MYLGSFFKALSPFASTAVSGVDAQVKAVLDKADADVAALRAKHAAAQNSTAVAVKRAAFEQFVTEYRASLSAQAANTKAVPNGATGPTGSTGATGSTHS